MHRTLKSLASLSRLIRDSSAHMTRPFIVALDGRSGSGKSTLARMLAAEGGVAVIAGDDFYAGGVGLRVDSPEDRVAACIDWTRQRAVLLALRDGREATWRAFDWDAFDGRLCKEPTVIAPRPVVVLEGVYAARPELADLVDLRLQVHVDDACREGRLLAREGTIGPWERQWHDAEAHYFTHIMPPAAFDAVLEGDAVGLGPAS